eukprot:m.477239 g.477239  ORF g.477239 m.477239 type:complete len:61 (+) comp20783_c0_seq1:247-429(+)
MPLGGFFRAVRHDMKRQPAVIPVVFIVGAAGVLVGGYLTKLSQDNDVYLDHRTPNWQKRA